ncbi:MAG TPA: WYL domain-containing protein [Streptosporangiaceae bacterium]|jgi:predicted DNA-binding transcriptional regulator YafY
MNRTDRLYALVEELRAVAPRPRSARQLAERYEVSTRTIERDILALQESGVPIYAETGRSGGYVIDKTVTLPPLNFSAAEMVAIAVSLAREEHTPFAAATRSALRKVLATASAAQTAEAGELLDRVRLISAARPGERRAAGAGRGEPDSGPPPARERAARERAGRELPGRKEPARERAARRWGAPPPPAVPLAIQEAITARHVLRITYRDRHDRETAREVEPVAFAATRTQWYLMAWCRLRGGARAFRVDRILAAADTGEPASPRSYRDLGVDIPDSIVRRPDLRG